MDSWVAVASKHTPSKYKGPTSYLGLIPTDIKRLLLRYYDHRLHCLLKGIPDMLPLVKHCKTTQVCAYAAQHGMIDMLSWAKARGYSMHQVFDIAVDHTKLDVVAWYIDRHDIDEYWESLLRLVYLAERNNNVKIVRYILDLPKSLYPKLYHRKKRRDLLTVLSDADDDRFFDQYNKMGAGGQPLGKHQFHRDRNGYRI